jgi:hypothetical protein
MSPRWGLAARDFYVTKISAIWAFREFVFRVSVPLWQKLLFAQQTIYPNLYVNLQPFQ